MAGVPLACFQVDGTGGHRGISVLLRPTLIRSLQRSIAALKASALSGDVMAKKRRASKPKFDTSFNFGANVVPKKAPVRRPRGGSNKSSAYFKGMYGS
jgi:hypothetical protein